MTTTIRTETGTKIRTATQRRFVVVFERDGHAHIEFRTDNIDKARRRAATSVFRTIFDLRTDTGPRAVR